MCLFFFTRHFCTANIEFDFNVNQYKQTNFSFLADVTNQLFFRECYFHMGPLILWVVNQSLKRGFFFSRGSERWDIMHFIKFLFRSRCKTLLRNVKKNIFLLLCIQQNISTDLCEISPKKGLLWIA